MRGDVLTAWRHQMICQLSRQRPVPDRAPCAWSHTAGCRWSRNRVGGEQDAVQACCEAPVSVQITMHLDPSALESVKSEMRLCRTARVEDPGRGDGYREDYRRDERRREEQPRRAFGSDEWRREEQPRRALDTAGRAPAGNQFAASWYATVLISCLPSSNCSWQSEVSLDAEQAVGGADVLLCT